MDFDKILDKILNKINEQQAKGSFKFDIENLDSIDKVEEIIEQVLKDEGYYDSIKEYRKVFDENLKEVVNQYKAFGNATTKDLTAFNKVAFDNFYNNLAVNFTETNLKQPIKDALLQHIAGDGKYSEFKNTVKDLMTTRKIEGNVDIVAREYLTQYKRAQGNILAKKYNIKYFRFKGSEIERKTKDGKVKTSRCFCLQRKGNIYTLDMIESWASLEWKGKIKGTNKSNISQLLGGWECVDDLVPVSEATAKREGYNKYNNVSCEL